MKTVRVFLVGIGGYGANYLNELERMADPDVIIEGVCDPMPGLKERFPVLEKRNIPIYQNIDEFYREHDADLAIISTPIHLHMPHAVACLKHSNVLVEKPVCGTLEEAGEMAAAERISGHFISVGYQMNYADNMKAMKRDILDGKFGKPVLMKGIHAFRRGEKYYHRNNWAGKRVVDGRILNDSPVSNSSAHQLQNMLFLLGTAMDRSAEIVKVEGQLYRTNPDVDNFDTAMLCAWTKENIPVYYYTTHNIEESQLGPITEFRFEEASIYYGKDFGEGPVEEYVAQWKDGRRVSYGETPTSDNFQKLYDAIECTRNGGHSICTMQAAMSHLYITEELAKLPITEIPREKVIHKEIDGDKFQIIDNIQNIFSECYENEKLLKK